jgi:hypothetical protein
MPAASPERRKATQANGNARTCTGAGAVIVPLAIDLDQSPSHRGEKRRELAAELGEMTTAGAGACRREAAAAAVLGICEGSFREPRARPCWLTSFHACVSAWTATRSVGKGLPRDTVFTAHRGLQHLLALDGISRGTSDCSFCVASRY